MSWSFSQSGGVKQVKDALKATYAGTPLNEPERNLRQKAENCLSEVQNKLGETWPVNFSGNGSQTEDGSGNVTAVSLSISITPVE